jgi:DNA-binding transcriptional regulator YiaG
LNKLADLMARYNLKITQVAMITGVSEKTVQRWLDEETEKRKPCPVPAYRLLQIVFGEARPEDFQA